MKLSILASLGYLVAYASAAPAHSPYVVHEKRELQVEKWSRRDLKLGRGVTIPMSIGLTQRNLENGHEFLMDVSHPESPNFGKHWSTEKVRTSLMTKNNAYNIRLPRHSLHLPKPSMLSRHGLWRAVFHMRGSSFRKV
jgi:hypothetical protein